MSEEVREKLPLEILREKYVPIVALPEMYGISVAKVMSLINLGVINKAEFRAPGDRRRTLHVNYEEVLSAIKEDIQ